MQQFLAMQSAFLKKKLTLLRRSAHPCLPVIAILVLMWIFMINILYDIYNTFFATIDLGLLEINIIKDAFQYLSACLRCWQCWCSLGCCCCHCYCCSCKSINRYTCIGRHISHNTFLLLLLLLILFATLTTALTADTTKPRKPKEDILFSATHSVSVS